MGAVMVYQSITGGNDLLRRYGKDEAEMPGEFLDQVRPEDFAQ